MTGTTEPIDARLIADLHAAFEGSIEQAGRDLAWQPLPLPVPRRRLRLAGPVAAAASIVIVAGVLALVAGRPAFGPSAIGPANSPATTASAEVASPPPSPTPRASSSSALAPSPTPELILAADGLPTTIDGVAVLSGTDAKRAFASAPDARSMLVGGWLGAPVLMSCPMVRPGDPWPGVCGGVRLGGTSAGGSPITLYRAPSSPLFPVVAEGYVMPIVLLVHTHDPACADLARCGADPVMQMVAWVGDAIAIPAPTSTRPPDGITRERAGELALNFAASQAPPPLTVASATAGPYGLVGPGGSDVDAERWVWAIVVTGQFGAPDCTRAPGGAPCGIVVDSELVVLDYRDGAFLMATAPAP